MFIRILQPFKEVLINTDNIWKIEVGYVEPDAYQQNWRVLLEDAMKNPNAKRTYKIFVRNESFFLLNNPNCPVVKVVEEIYKNTIKG